jgi:hypothetical protein
MMIFEQPQQLNRWDELVWGDKFLIHQGMSCNYVN